MDKDKIVILGLVVVVIALLVALVAVIPHTNKQNTNLTFESGQELNEGDSVQIKLTDANGTVLSNQTVNITVTDKDRTSDYHSVVTNVEGVGSLKIDKSAGEYNITISYGGNDKYNGCNATQKITIKEKVTQKEESTSDDGIEKYRTRSGTYLKVMPSGDVVEMSADGQFVVSVNGDPHASF